MRLRLLLLLLSLCLPLAVWAQVSPPLPSGGGSGTLTLPETICVNQVASALAASGILTCTTVTPPMTTGLAPTGVDIDATGQVISLHLAQPLPPSQGGIGISTGTPGGLPYFTAPDSLASSNAFPLNAPLLGGGPGQPPYPGTLSGTSPELGTVLGPHTTGVALEFDAAGNIIAGSGTLSGGTVSSVFGRQGVVVAQPGDYTASQVTGAADLTLANVFTHPSGQTMPRLVLQGSVAGTLTLVAPPSAGTA